MQYIRIEVPLSCPSCGNPIKRVKDQIFCTSQSCEGLLGKRILNFCKKMKIKGLGEARLKALNLNYIPDIYSLDIPKVEKVLGNKVANTLLKEISLSLNKDITQVLASLSIHLIGNTYSNLFLGRISSLKDITPKLCISVGLKEKATASLLEWISSNSDLIDNLPEYSQGGITTARCDATTSAVNHITVCISGKLSKYPNKAAANLYLESIGCKVVSAVTKTTSYLINEDGKETTKVKKAASYGIDILTLEELERKIQ